MSSIYRPTHRKNGKLIRMKKWYVRYRDHEGKLKTVPGFTDKTATQQLASKLEKEAAMIRAGLLEPAVLYQSVSLDTHLAAFETSLKAKNVSVEQVRLVVYRCKNLFEAAKITRLSGINAEVISSTLAEMRATSRDGQRGQSVQTSNHYLRAIKQFSRWLVKDRRASDDPLAFIAMLNVSTDRRHDRRPLNEAELTALLQVAAINTLLEVPGSTSLVLMQSTVNQSLDLHNH